ncbi:FadR/GntR family transcriptional regulator [Cryptosporangium aurantiacum]|uniref:DNA-binding transcriptional regulator, FadR family n=1 Tax=Cryptosporangium aurantiacum TaxID=134849 RepID=A0A1M7QS47_9ACTN|nr:FCD domain-containing protein [Cryptosporangium aurantiacum]SHN34466.1 DNA-binding transcriptional regulator, FadR family [Cryptosporangium aurantiacum]
MHQYVARGVHGQTVEVLAQRILTGQIPEGATLDITALQSELDVSLTALREAMRVLAAKGLVDARPKRGTFVRPRGDWSLLDPDVLRWQFSRQARPGLFADLSELRSIVEPGAASLAAERATDEDIAALDAALEAMAAAGDDASAAVDADLAFHRALLAATHNELLQRMEVLIETGLAERDRMVHGHGPGDPLPSHQAVVEAIRQHDRLGAAQAMGRLLEQAIEDVAKLERAADEDR